MVDAGAVGVGDGVEDEEGFAGGARGLFGGLKEGGSDAAAARATVDEHFAEVGAVGLVFGKVEVELDCAAGAELVLCDEEGALGGVDVGGDLAPEGEGAFAGEWVHEADGGAAGDAVD